MNKKPTPQEIKQQREEAALARQAQREEVLDLEMKARWWKAQWEIRYFTLQAEKIQPEYQEYLDKAEQERERLKQEMINKLKEGGMDISPENLISIKPDDDAR
jgi:hypothetical protein